MRKIFIILIFLEIWLFFDVYNQVMATVDLTRISFIEVALLTFIAMFLVQGFAILLSFPFFMGLNKLESNLQQETIKENVK